MQRSLAFTVSLFLLLLLLGTAFTLPLVDPNTKVNSQALVLNPEGERYDTEALNVDPSAHIIPVVFEVDPFSSLELEEESAGGKSVEEGGVRRRRQTTVSGGFNREDLGGGARRDSGNINVSHTNNKHTVTGGFSLDRTKIPGVGSSRNFGVNAGYQFKPNNNTSFNVGVSHNRGSAGRSTSFGVGFSHTFGRR